MQLLPKRAQLVIADYLTLVALYAKELPRVSPQ